MKKHTETVIDVSDWDNLVMKTYGKPYSFQQQDGCRSRGFFRFRVPDKADDYDKAAFPEMLNGEEMGVSFATWLARNPRAAVGSCADAWEVELWWNRNFYPDQQMIANDLYAQGLLPAGEYTISIDW